MGPEEVLVTRESAIQRGSAQLKDTLPVNEDHSNVVKFREDGRSYRKLLWLMQGFLDVTTDAHNRVSSMELTQRFEESSKKSNALDSSTAHYAADVDSRSLLMRKFQEGCDNSRLEEVKPASPSTFEWVWEKHSLGFVEWLSGGEGLYFISGKSGSGKSTLMKSIFSHERTRRILEARKTSRPVTQAGFFFHKRGSHFQKSFAGLLCSLLYQLLRAAPELQTAVAGAMFTSHPSVVAQRNLTVTELKRAFDALLDQKSYPLDALVFLDALDEYDGSPEVISQFIQLAAEVRAGSSTRIQICFAYRPWNVFVEHFSGCSGLKIHENTEEDIRRFKLAKIADRPGLLKSLGQIHTYSSSESVDPLQKIVRKAQGVFLWVALVVEVLRLLSSDGITQTTVLSILDRLPDDLEDIYNRTIDRIPPAYRKEAFVMMEVVARSPEVLPLTTLIAVSECALREDFDESKRWLADYLASPARHGAEVMSRCRGLVEVVYDESRSMPIVRLMHQTVKEFILRPGFRARLLRGDLTAANGFTYLSRGTLVLASLLVDHGQPTELSTDNVPGHGDLKLVIDCAYLSEVTTGFDQSELIAKAADAAVKVVAKVASDETMDYNHLNSTLAFGAVANLQIYMKKTLDKGHKLLESEQASPLLCLVDAVKER